jgi:NAD-dependent deacetylase
MKEKLVVLTGAGISAESGLQTFRDQDGLWMGYNVYEVATPEGWQKDPAMVLDFYNQRREEVATAEPNTAHIALAKLQEKYEVTIVTQNIDDLHERAGVKDVVHLHGEIFKMRSEKNENIFYEIQKDIQLGDLASDGGQLRPHVVWFGEAVPMIEKAMRIMTKADLFILAGTSLQVYPASGLIDFLPPGITKYIIDRNPPYVPAHHNFKVIAKTATEGMKELLPVLMEEKSMKKK